MARDLDGFSDFRTEQWTPAGTVGLKITESTNFFVSSWGPAEVRVFLEQGAAEVSLSAILKMYILHSIEEIEIIVCNWKQMGQVSGHGGFEKQTKTIIKALR